MWTSWLHCGCGSEDLFSVLHQTRAREPLLNSFRGIPVEIFPTGEALAVEHCGLYDPEAIVSLTASS